MVTSADRPAPAHPRLIHRPSGRIIPLPEHRNLVLLGKPNTHLPPDIDLSEFPDATAVSRVHARILLVPPPPLLEDMGSTNGTYLNGQRLWPGERQPLTAGDAIALGGDRPVVFEFQSG